MRRACLYVVVASLLCPPCARAQRKSSSAERKSWTKIRYIGGTVAIKTSQFDWNTTLTVTPDTIGIEIAPETVFAPKKTVRLKPSQVLSLSADEAAWQHVAAVGGAVLPAKHPTLFGLLRDFELFGVVYDTGDGKRGALLLDSYFSGVVLRVLSRLSGKPIENTP
jgi:hypothetical protein